ncbi:MAG: lysophospholipid acyltransferase family protein [Formosimonas sp.]
MRLLGHLAAIARLCVLVVHIVLGLFVGLVVFRFIDWGARTRIISIWSRMLLGVIGVKLVLDHPPPHKPMKGLQVSNHSSWMDIFVSNSVQAARFLAKSDIQKWPVLGTLVTSAGTLYVERGNRHSINKTNAEITASARNGELIGLYPEGTTTDGTHLLPFKSNLFQPAIDNHMLVYPVGISYKKNGRYTPLAAYAGDTSLLKSFWDLTSSFGVSAHVSFGHPIVAADYSSRQALALEAQSAVARLLGQEVISADTYAQMQTGV